MPAVAAAPQASILEIFKSRQGEGICVGDPQVFVRFGGCNLICTYCDTPESIPAKSGRPHSLNEVLEQLDAADAEADRVVSLTGGEPLVQVQFLQELIPELRRRGWRIYLETNGALPGALEKVVGSCDWVAMDLKPASATGRDLWEAHQWFLKTCGNNVFVKMVLTESTQEEEFRRGVDLLAALRPNAPLILQPATPWGPSGSIPLDRLTSWWMWAAKRLPDVRVIPQIHRLWGIA